MLTFEELGQDACRWPVAEFDRGEFLFCGEPAAKSGSCPYCRGHMALAYKPSRCMRPAGSAGPPVARLEAHESARRELIAVAAGTASSAAC
jgi:GcrA cell cycle regulator